MHKYKFSLILYTICVLLVYPLESIVIPKIYSNFFSIINDSSQLNNTVFIDFFKKIIIFSVVIAIAQKYINKLEIYLIPEFNESLSNLFFEKILHHYENNYTDLELGKIITRINSLPATLKEVTTDLFNWVIPKILTLVVINIYFYTINKTFGIVSTVILTILVLLNMNTFQPCIDISNERYDNYENKSEQLQDKLSNLYSIYSTGNINNEIDSFGKITSAFKKLQRESMKCSYKIKNKNGILVSISFFILAYYIVYLFRNNQITKEILVTLFLTLTFYMPCLNTILTYLPDYTNHLGIINSLNDYIDLIFQKSNIKPDINITKGDININNLNFGYTKEKQIFTNFNLTIKANEKVGIIGPSGNGKSTLIKLIMGYYQVPENTIFIDGQDINKYNLNSLRKQVIYINQNTKLFNKTIYENIKYGNNITDEDITRVYNEYKLDRIFKNLSEGFNTNVGVNGDSLSGGQKQIVLLLRNYFKSNKIIIMDEPTAALDNDTRKLVIELINKISKNSTLLIITHDENNLDNIKKKYYIINGKLKQ